MSYSYTLVLTTPLSDEEALHLVQEMPGFERGQERSALGPGIVVSIRAADEEDQEAGREFEGFAPKLCVSLTKKRGNRDGLLEADNVLCVTMLLLSRTGGRTGEAVVRAEGDLWLRQVGGILWLNTDSDLWQDYHDLLPLITLPYRTAALPDSSLEPQE